MSQPLKSIKRKIARSAIDGHPNLRPIGELLVELLELPVSLRRSVADEDWNQALILGIRCMGLGNAALRLFQGYEIQSTDRLRRLRNIERLFDQGDSGNGGDTPLPHLHFLPENAKDLPIVSLSRGLLGVAHAEFNVAFQTERIETLARFPEDTTLAYKNCVTDFGTLLRQGQKRVYGTATTEKSRDEMTAEASVLAASIELKLPAFARTQALVCRVARALRDQGKGTAAEKLGRVAMEAGALTREAIASHAAGHRLSIELLKDEPDPDALDLYRKASERPFDTEIPNGKNTQLAKLDQISDGQFVEIEGYATRIEATRGDKGLLSRIELLDPSSGATANAAAVFMHLPHLGVTDGAYCRLNGIFRKQSALLDKKPGVEIDRLSLSDLGKQSWRIAFLQSAVPWYQTWRNGINLYWSLGPHRHKDAADSESLEGAGELIYPHFRKT